jgi:hypothetical protein
MLAKEGYIGWRGVGTVYEVGYRGTFKILGFFVDCTDEAGHGVQCSGAVQYIDVQKSEKCEAELP